MLTNSKFYDMVEEVKNHPNFKKISRSSQRYFENSVDSLFATLGGIDEDDVEEWSDDMAEKIFSAKVRYHFSKKNEAEAIKLIKGYQALLAHVR